VSPATAEPPSPIEQAITAISVEDADDETDRGADHHPTNGRPVSRKLVSIQTCRLDSSQNNVAPVLVPQRRRPGETPSA